MRGPGGTLGASAALLALLAFAVGLLAARAGLIRGWESARTLPGIVSWALPITVLAMICGLAIRAWWRFARGIHALRREIAWSQASGAAPETTASIRDFLEASRVDPHARSAMFDLPPLSNRIVAVLARQAAAWQKLDPSEAIARFGEVHAERILGGAQIAVALGLLGSMLGLAVQAWQGLGGADVSAVFGEDLATGVMVAVTTTVQGFVVAAYIAVLERMYRERFAASADGTLELFQRGALREAGRPSDALSGLELALERFARRFSEIVDDLGRRLPDEVRRGVEQASQALATTLTAPLDYSVNALGGRVGEISDVVRGLDTTVDEAGKRIALGVDALQRSSRSPQELAAIVAAAVDSLEAARQALETAAGVSHVATEGLAAMADRLSAAAAAAKVAATLPMVSRVADIEARFVSLCDHLERMLNAVSQLSRTRLVNAGLATEHASPPTGMG